MCVKYTYLPPDLRWASLADGTLLCVSSDVTGNSEAYDVDVDDVGVWGYE